MFKLDLDQFQDLQKDLQRLNRKGFPYATREALNSVAFGTRNAYREQAKRKMIIRNAWTVRGIRATETRALTIARQETRAGAIQQYMADQEGGVTRMREGKEGYPIPTTFASGEGEGARPRRKDVKAAMRRSRISLSRKKIRTYSKRQEIFVRALLTVDAGKQFMYVENENGRKGIYRVSGGKMGKRGRRRKLRMQLVWDLTEPSVSTPPNPMLRPALEQSVPQMPAHFKRALLFQLELAKSWGRV